MADTTQRGTTTTVIRNPYYEKLTQEITIRLSKEAIKYFEELADERKISLSRILDIYLCECMENKRVPHFPWEDEVK